MVVRRLLCFIDSYKICCLIDRVLYVKLVFQIFFNFWSNVVVHQAPKADLYKAEVFVDMANLRGNDEGPFLTITKCYKINQFRCNITARIGATVTQQINKRNQFSQLIDLHEFTHRQHDNKELNRSEY